MSESLTIEEVVSLDDPALDDILDIYQKTFPLQEQMPVSFFTRSLRKTNRTDDDGRLYAVKLAGKVIGLVDFLIVAGRIYERDVRVCWLYYLGLAPEFRNAGHGRSVYEWTVNQAFKLDCLALFIEVESPAHAPDAQLAIRRRNWYRRNGAKMLTGVRYEQTTGWQPPLDMDICIHSSEPLTADEAFELAKSLVNDSIVRVADLGFA